jgi:hypothetical protein
MITRAAFLLLVPTSACAPKTTNANKEETVQNEVVAPEAELTQPVAPGVSPRWRVGDEWDVVYKISVPSYKKLADPPPNFEEHGWSYAVESIADDGEVIIVCRRTRRLVGGMVTAAAEPVETWRMRFASSGPLRTLEEVDDGGERESISFAPYVKADDDDGGTVRLAKEWPKFPLRPGEDLQQPDGSLAQHVEEHDELLRVTMVARASDEGDTIQRTVVQEWERDRPWWSSVMIRSKSTWRGETYDDFVLQGRVTTWRLKEGE